MSFWTGFKQGLLLQNLGWWWCEIAHGGGDVKRNADDCIDWQCDKCGRWASLPVSKEDEAVALDRHIARRKDYGQT